MSDQDGTTPEPGPDPVAELWRMENEARQAAGPVPSDDAEPANGTVVVDASHIAWQRRDADAFAAPVDRWFQVGQEDGDPWAAVLAAGPVTVAWTPTPTTQVTAPEPGARATATGVARQPSRLADDLTARLAHDRYQKDTRIAQLEERLARAGEQAVQDYIRQGAAADAWMTAAQVRQALEQADAQHASERDAALAEVAELRRQLALLDRENELLADERDEARRERIEARAELADVGEQAAAPAAHAKPYAELAAQLRAEQGPDAALEVDLTAARAEIVATEQDLLGLVLRLVDAERVRDAALADVERLERENGSLARITDNGRGYPTYYLWENGRRVQLVTLKVFTTQYEEVAGALRRAQAELAAVRTEADSWRAIARENGDELVRCQEDADALRAELDAALAERARLTREVAGAEPEDTA